MCGIDVQGFSVLLKKYTPDSDITGATRGGIPTETKLHRYI